MDAAQKILCAPLADAFAAPPQDQSVCRYAFEGRPRLPSPRGPISHAVIKALSRPTGSFSAPCVRTDDILTDEDFQLALYCCYELHYQGFAGVSDEWEWNPGLLQLRSELERAFEESLRTALPDESTIAPAEVPEILWQLTRGTGFSLSGWLQQHGTRFHAREIAVHRSGYQLKEADPHTWAIPRLNGRAKAAIVTIQSDEYGGGIAASMHSSLFADAMKSLGLDATYGRIPRPSAGRHVGHDESHLDVRTPSPPPWCSGRAFGEFRDEFGGSDGSLQRMARVARGTRERPSVLRRARRSGRGTPVHRSQRPGGRFARG